jgi:FAD synthase
VEFIARLREERHYDNLDLLVEQIHRDARAAREHFGI